MKELLSLRNTALMAVLPVLVCGQTTVGVPSTAPSGAMQVSPSFPNTGFELSTFQLYAQTSPSDTSANQYSINLLNAIFSRTGGQPVLRVGGTSGDSAAYNTSQTQPVFPAPGTSQTGSLSIGPNFWKLTQLLSPTNPLWMPQISYTNTDASQTTADAKSIASSIGLSNLIAIGISNEPNEYGGHSGPSATNDTYYANRFQSIATTAANAIGISSTRAFFAGPDLASYDQRSTDWSITDLFSQTNFDSTGNIRLATDHWYRCSGGACSLPDVMNHAKMVSNSAHIASAVKYFQTYKNGQVEYVLDEFNVLNGAANSAFSSSLATALYSVDFMMYGMSIGLKRVHWEQVYGSNQALWQPSSSSSVAKQTRSGYYALIAAAEFIGNTGGNTRVVQITPQGNDGTTFSSYVAYNGSTPVHVALLNLNYWDQSQGTSRPTPRVQVNGIPAGKTSVVVKYLTNPGGAGADASQTTFGGSQWPASSQGKEQTGVQNTTVDVIVSNGVAQIPVPYSSVAIVYL